MSADADFDRRVLAYDPWGGDKDDGGVRVFSDQMVTARSNGGQCWVCGGQIQPGTRIRVETARVDETIQHARVCHDCCVAMAAARDDGGTAYEARINLYRTRGGAGQVKP